MKVTFDNVLVCDVVTYSYENKKYPKALVYQKGNLYQIGITNERVKEIMPLIGTFSTFDTEMTSFNGKNKFVLV